MLKKRSLGLILIAILVLLPVACKKGGSADLPLGSVGDFRTLIAKDAAGFAIMNFKAMAEKGLFDELIKDEESLKGLNDFKKKTGLDPKKDLQTGIIVFMNLPSGPQDTNQNMYFAVSGKFDQKKILASMKAEAKAGFKTESVSGYTLYHGVEINAETAQTAPATPKDIFISFKGNDLIFFSPDKNAILTACQLADGKKEGLAKDSLVYEMTDKVNHDHMFWGLFTIPEAAKKEMENGPGMMFPAFKDITAIYFGGTYDGKALLFDANLYTAKDESLKELTTTLNSFKDMIKSFAAQGEGQSPETAKAMAVIDKIKISQEKESVKITVSLTKEELESLSPKPAESAVE